MKQITSIILDDELHGRENLKTLLETYCNEVEVLDIAESAETAKHLVQKLNPDVVFLDINMPGLDGFDFLEMFEKRNFMVVIVSAHSDYGVRAVKTKVDDYLMKPVHIKELQQTVAKLINLREEKSLREKTFNQNKLSIPIANGFEVVEISEIVRFEGEGCYTKIILRSGKSYFVSKTLKEFTEHIPQKLFYRIHKSHLINLNHIKEFSKIDGGFVTMSNGDLVEVSRRRLHDFMETIKKMTKPSK